MRIVISISKALLSALANVFYLRCFFLYYFSETAPKHPWMCVVLFAGILAGFFAVCRIAMRHEETGAGRKIIAILAPILGIPLLVLSFLIPMPEIPTVPIRDAAPVEGFAVILLLLVHLLATIGICIWNYFYTE